MKQHEHSAPCDRRAFLAISASGVASLHPALAGALASSKSGAPVVAPGWIPSESLLSELPSLMHVACVPGLSMAVVEDGAVTWTRAFGVLNATMKDVVRADTLFEAASISKAVFAYAVLQLADEGRLDLDRPLVAYHRPSYLPDDPLIARITARHVLTHSSGLPALGDDQRPASFKPSFAPGSAFSYSGEGTFWLQLVVEHITGLGLSAFMRTQLFERAGMQHSTFIGDASHASQSAFGHQNGVVARDQGWRNVLGLIVPLQEKWNRAIRDWSNDDWVRAAAEIDSAKPAPARVRFQNAAASMLTTATDCARFITLAMERPQRASWEISDGSRRAMVAPQVAVREGGALWWGLGWAVQRDTDWWRVSHEGNNGDRFTSYAGFDPVRRRGMVVLTNSGSGFGVYQRIVRAATGLDQLSFVAEMNPPRGAGK